MVAMKRNNMKNNWLFFGDTCWETNMDFELLKIEKKIAYMVNLLLKMVKEPMYRYICHCFNVHEYFFRFIWKIYYTLKKKAIQMHEYMYENVIDYNIFVLSYYRWHLIHCTMQSPLYNRIY